jgi:hypothetical protein
LIAVETEILLQDKWYKAIGLAPNVEQQSLNFLLNQLKTDLYTAETVGPRKEALPALEHILQSF